MFFPFSFSSRTFSLLHSVSAVSALLVYSTLSVRAGDTPQSQKSKDTMRVHTPAVTVQAVRANAITSPVTFNELSRAEIRDKNTLTDVPALLADQPSTVFYSDNANGIGYSYLTMRGFDQRRIAVLINGIPQNDPEDHNVYWIDFPDLSSSLDNIQVQRGAGLIRYGAAAIGGSINLSTINIAQQRFARLSFGVGLQDHQSAGLNAAPADVSTLASSKASFEYCSGLTDNNTAFYARVSQIQSRGYRDYSWARLNSYFLSAGKFEDDYSLQLNVYGGPISDGLAYTGMPKADITHPVRRRLNSNGWAYDSTSRSFSYYGSRRPNEQEQFSQPHAELIASLTLSKSVTLGSTLFAYTGTGFFDYDGSWADASVLRLTSVYGGSDTVKSPGNALIRAQVNNRQLGWIPYMAWAHANGEFSLGAEIRVHRSEHFATIAYAESLPAGFDPDFRIYSYEGSRDIFSVFAREQYQLTSNLRFNLEAQVVSSSYALSNEHAGRIATNYETISEQTIGNGAQLFNVNYLFFNPRVGLMWNLSAQHNLYFSLANTQREPRMANLYAAEESFYTGTGPLFATDTSGGRVRYDFSTPLIKPESMLDVELGWNHRTEIYKLGATFYYMSFSNELVKNGRRDIFGNPMTGNAPKTLHTGIEVQGAATLWKEKNSAIDLQANMTYSRNRIIDYHYIASSSTLDLSDNPVASFPDLLANISLNVSIRDAALSLSAKYIGTMYSDNFGDKLQQYRSAAPGEIAYADNVIDPVMVLNATLRYDVRSVVGLQKIRLRIQVNNLLNTLYAAGANGAEFFPAAERNAFVGVELEP